MKMDSPISPLFLAPHDASPSSTEPTAMGGSGTETKTILVVDDDVDLRFLVQVLMNISGYNVVTASDGIEALTQVREKLPDLILLDITMPHIDGLNVLRLLRSHEPTAHVPIILLSALTGSDIIEKGMEAGANSYVTKPFEAKQLAALVAETLS